jgi:toxin ParE1/3/4
MRTIFFTPQAKRDLKNIRAYIRKENSQAADAFVRKIHRDINTLPKSPYIGVERDTLGKDIRMLPLKTYQIFYRVETNRIVLLRVLHSARNITPLYFNQ